MTDSNPATAIPEGATSLSDMFGKRLDGYLPTLQSDEARLLYLRKCRDSWSGRYAHFIQTDGDSERPDPKFGKPTAWDFANTISEIETRMSRYERATESA